MVMRFFTLTEEHKLEVSANKVPRKMFGLERDEGNELGTS
jgi:hypothetical protein